MFAARSAFSSMKLRRGSQRIQLDELPPRLDLVAHQHREHVVGLDRVLDLAPSAGGARSGPSWFPTAARGSSRPDPCSAGGRRRSRPAPSARPSRRGSRRPCFPSARSPSPRLTTASAPSRPLKVMPARAQRVVVGAVHEVLRDDAGLGVAVVLAARCAARACRCARRTAR